MARQKVVGGQYLDFVDRSELDGALTAHFQAYRAHDEKLMKGVRRIRSTSPPASLAGGSVLVGGPEFMDGPAASFCWAIHRITITDNNLIPMPNGTRFQLEIAGSQPTDASLVNGRGIGPLDSGPLGNGYVTLGKGALTLFTQDMVVGKATTVNNPDGITSSGPYTLCVEGFEVPRELLWKLVL